MVDRVYSAPFSGNRDLEARVDLCLLVCQILDVMSEFRLVVLVLSDSELLRYGQYRKCHGLSDEVPWIMF